MTHARSAVAIFDALLAKCWVTPEEHDRLNRAGASLQRDAPNGDGGTRFAANARTGNSCIARFSDGAAYMLGMTTTRTDRYPDDITVMVRRIESIGIASYARELGGSTQALRRYLLRRGVDLCAVSTPGRVQKAEYPTTEAMLEHINAKGTESLARTIGVSGNAIRKELARRGATLPRRRYIRRNESTAAPDAAAGLLVARDTR
ncbi:hypothetical protein [Microbacterium aquimaris]|nr:hypothetical protein [Microbacterium aquimaris]